MVADPRRYAIFDTPIGVCAVVWGPRGLQHFLLPESSEARLRARLGRDVGGALPGRPPAAIRTAMELVRRHLGGAPQDLTGVPIDLTGVGPFARRVYRALRLVPPGRTVTYGELARRVGSPGAARAVGQAMARNPLGLVVPCHRVLCSSGRPGGFSGAGGVRLKAALLALEGVTLGSQARRESVVARYS